MARSIFLNSTSIDIPIPTNREERVRRALRTRFPDIDWIWNESDRREFIIGDDCPDENALEFYREIEDIVREALGS